MIGPSAIRLAQEPLRIGADAVGLDSLVEAAELEAEDHGPLDWLAEGALIAGQPAVLGGPEKTLKTSLALDLAVSVATGSPFLGEFAIPSPRHVLFISAESGRSTVASTLHRIVEARRDTLVGLGVDPKQLNISFSFNTLPLGHRDLSSVLHEKLAARQTGLLVVDPFYLNAGAGGGTLNPADMFAMAARLRPLTEACRPIGCVPLVLHHSNSSLHLGKPMELAQLAFEGLPQWVRQWTLLSRAKRYRDDGRHELVARIGQAGVGSGLWRVMVDEQLAEGRVTGWEVAVEPYLSAPQVKGAAGPKPTPLARHAAAVLMTLRELCAANKGERVLQATVKKRLKEKGLSLNGTNFKAAVERLVKRGDVVQETQLAERKGRPAQQVYLSTPPGQGQ
jgi:hypothetical protein